MTFPKSKLAQCLLFFGTQFFSFFLCVASTRAVAIGSYLWTGTIDVLWSVQNFGMAKLMIDNKEARGFWPLVGFTLGGTLGSLVGIFITKHLYGH